MDGALSFADHPTALKFLRCPARETGFFGGIRNAKTTVAIVKLLEAIKAWPGGRHLIGRADFTDLQSSTQKEFFLRFNQMNGAGYSFEPPSGGPFQAKYNSVSHDLNIRALKTEIHFRHVKDVYQSKGAEYACVYLDEPDEFGEETYNWILGRMSWWTREKLANFRQEWGKYQRQIWGFETVPQSLLMVTGNPSPGWTKKRFKDSPGTMKVFEASTDENKRNLPEGYIEHLRDTMPQVWVRRFLDGSWDASEGLVYPEFDESIHCIEPFEIPSHWVRELAMDHGFRNPTAFGFWAIDEDGNYYLFDLHYEAGKDVQYHADAVKAKSAAYRMRVTDNGSLFSWADPSAFNKYQAGINSIAELYQAEDITLIRANNDVKTGLLRCQQLLHVDPAHKHPFTGKLGAPRLYVVARNCGSFLDEIRTYQWKEVKAAEERNVVEEPRKKNDHAMDMMKYFVLSHTGAAALPEKKPTLFDFNIWQRQQIVKKAFEPVQTADETLLSYSDEDGQ